MAKDSYDLKKLAEHLRSKTNSTRIDTYNKVINGVVTVCKCVFEFQP